MDLGRRGKRGGGSASPRPALVTVSCEESGEVRSAAPPIAETIKGHAAHASGSEIIPTTDDGFGGLFRSSLSAHRSAATPANAR